MINHDLAERIAVMKVAAEAAMFSERDYLRRFQTDVTPTAVLSLIALVEQQGREIDALTKRSRHYFEGLERIWRGLDLTLEPKPHDVAKLQRVAHDYMDETKVPSGKDGD